MDIFPLLTSGVGLAGTTGAAIRSWEVTYRHGDQLLEGFIAWDQNVRGRRPGVLVFPDWMGVGPVGQEVARRLAQSGYVAFVGDMYGKGIRPKDRQQASQLAGSYRKDRPLMRARAKASLDELERSEHVDAHRTAAIGYCFGGTVALELARSGAALSGVVSLHGGLETPSPADAKTFKPRVLALHGADDPLAPTEHRVAFEDEMRKAGADWQMVVYGGAVHAFTNRTVGNDKSSGLAYDERADRRSWEAMLAFFQEIFG
jgi:dienelactone hydrolase